MRRDFLQVTRHQGGVEALFRDSMATKGVVVEQSVIPTSIELSHEKSEYEDLKTYAVKVCGLVICLICEIQSLSRFKVTLKYLDSPEHEEVVHAKFVLGADGEPWNEL